MLEKMLCPSTYKRGALTVLKCEEEAVLTKRLIYDGKRGFAVGEDTLKSFDVTDLFRRATQLERRGTL